MTTYRRGWHIAAIIAGLTTAWATALAAQGAAQQRRTAAPATAGAEGDAAPSALAVELAGGLLKTLMGTWRFEVRFAGNFTDAPDASGARVFAALFDDTRLEWTESVDSSAMSARGILGFDPRTGQFYSTAVNSSGPGIELLTGSMDLSEPVILFTPTAPAASADPSRRHMESFTLRMIDADHFMWSPLDRSWRAVFTRRPEPRSATASPVAAPQRLGDAASPSASTVYLTHLSLPVQLSPFTCAYASSAGTPRIDRYPG